MLREERLTVSEAGYEMGFENLGHFTKVFEKHIGKKPRSMCKVSRSDHPGKIHLSMPDRSFTQK